jgi:hypothetical protein
MTTRIWNGTSQGEFLDSDDWINGAPEAGDTAVIYGVGDAPVETGVDNANGYEINNNPLVRLYSQSETVLSVLDADGPPTDMPSQAPISNISIDAIGGTSVVGFGLVDTTLDTTSTVTVSGIAVMNGYYTDALNGVITVEPTAGAANDSNGDNGELDLTTEPVGSVDPLQYEETQQLRSFIPSLTNNGVIIAGTGSGLILGFVGVPVDIVKNGTETLALGGRDAFVNNGIIVLADSNLSVNAGFSDAGYGWNTFTNNGLIVLGGALPAFQGAPGTSGAAYFDAQILGSGTISLLGTPNDHAAADFAGGIIGGTIEASNADVEFTNDSPYTATIAASFAFAGGGSTLLFGDEFAPVSRTVTMPISGFQAGDTIEINGDRVWTDSLNGVDATAISSWDQATQTLTIEAVEPPDFFIPTQTVDVDSLTLLGNYTNDAFTVVGAGTLLTVTTTAPAPSCYCRGTLILTDRGEVAVEDLHIGDQVVTNAGQTRPIRWIGHRLLDLGRHAKRELVQPVRIRAHAFANGQPRRDLLVSPDHAVFFNGRLIPARLLVNGGSIGWETSLRTVTYYHIELDTHDVILAEGLPAESYLDTGNRDGFANGGRAVQLHPDFSSHLSVGSAAGPARSGPALPLRSGCMVPPLPSPAGTAKPRSMDCQQLRQSQSCVPFEDHPAVLEPIWRMLSARGEAIGWTSLGQTALTDDPALHVLSSTGTIKPIFAAGDFYAFLLPADEAALRLVTRAARPCDERPWICDQRRLGVMVRRLRLRHGSEVRDIALDAPALDQGWWAVEWLDGAPCRWTDGAALLQGLGVGVLEVELAGKMRYPACCDFERRLIAA